MTYILAAGGEWVPIVIVLGIIIFRVVKSIVESSSSSSSSSTQAPKPSGSTHPTTDAEKLARLRREQLQELARRRQEAMQRKQQSQQSAGPRPVPTSHPSQQLTAQQLRRQRLEQLRQRAPRPSQVPGPTRPHLTHQPPPAPSQSVQQARALAEAQAAAAAKAEQDRLEEIDRRRRIAMREATLENQREQRLNQWESAERQRMEVVAGDPGHDEQVHRHIADAPQDKQVVAMSHSQWIRRLGQMNRATLQRAIILKEVLDTPVGLR